MRYIWQHITTLIANYNGGIPLSHFLKNYFRQHAKLGSRDRKILSEMIYCWYRVSKALPAGLSLEDKLQLCLFLCETTVPQVLRFIPQDWQQKKSLSQKEKLTFLYQQGIEVNVDELVSFAPLLSEGISKDEWLNAMLHQPDLFIRVREKGDKIKQLLNDNALDYTVVDDHCLSLKNGAPIDKLLQPAWYAVQDASSQKTGSYFHAKPGEQWWDCCSGAGGKSLLLKDIQQGVNLTVSDKRTTILHNLSERFKLYGHQAPEQIVLDMADSAAVKRTMGSRRFDNIICDVPCSGAGTWARTPEQLYFFEEALIGRFATLQQTIAGNAIQYLKPGGRMIYITCSVFRQENEDVVAALGNMQGITVSEQQLINGMPLRADSMFVAILQRT